MSKYVFLLALIGLTLSTLVLTSSTLVLILRPTSVMLVCSVPTRDFGEWVYLTKPDTIMRAIRVSEGVPSYGIMWLAREYGSHESVPQAVGRKHAGRLLHRIYRRWVQAGRPGSFLTYLRDTWAPIDAPNDPTGLNHNWAQNVALNLAMQMVQD